MVSSLKENFGYGLISLVLAGYSVSEHLDNILPVNNQRIQGKSDNVCYTQISTTDYYLKTIALNPIENIEEVCRRGDLAAEIIRKYVFKKQLPKMDCNKTDGFGDMMVITTDEFLDYFMFKKPNR